MSENQNPEKVAMELTDPPYVSYIEFSKAMIRIEHRLTRVEVIASIISPIATAIFVTAILTLMGVV